jgi:hypothetical protein
MPSVALRRRRLGNRLMPSSSAKPSRSARDRDGYSRMRIIPSPRRTSRCGEPTVSTERKKVRSRGSRGKWRCANPCIPSQSASSDVETSITLTLSVGCSARARAIATRTATPVALSLAPGTVSRRPMSASSAADSAARAVPALTSPGLSASAPPATSAGIATTGANSGGLVSTRWISHGARPKTIFGIAGW